jgi:ABC-2 type transport system ATP-binding protein
MTLIEIQKVSKSLGSFGRKHPILCDVNLTIEAGEFVVLAGDNGSGKSTLINLILGLIYPDQAWESSFKIQLSLVILKSGKLLSLYLATKPTQ